MTWANCRAPWWCSNVYVYTCYNLAPMKRRRKRRYWDGNTDESSGEEENGAQEIWKQETTRIEVLKIWAIVIQGYIVKMVDIFIEIHGVGYHFAMPTDRLMKVLWLGSLHHSHIEGEQQRERERTVCKRNESFFRQNRDAFNIIFAIPFSSKSNPSRMNINTFSLFYLSYALNRNMGRL